MSVTLTPLFFLHVLLAGSVAQVTKRCWEECGKIGDTAGKGCSSQKPKVITKKKKKRGLAAFCEARMRTDTQLVVPQGRSPLSIGGLGDTKYNKSFNGGLLKGGGGALWISRTSGTKPSLASSRRLL